MFYAIRRIYDAGRIVWAFSKPIAIPIFTRIISPVVPANIGTTNDICSQCSSNVPCVVSVIVPRIIRIVEVVVVDQVVVRGVEVNAGIVVRCRVVRDGVVRNGVVAT